MNVLIPPLSHMVIIVFISKKKERQQKDIEPARIFLIISIAPCKEFPALAINRHAWYEVTCTNNMVKSSHEFVIFTDKF
jgi:hypothetical protein